MTRINQVRFRHTGHNLEKDTESDCIPTSRGPQDDINPVSNDLENITNTFKNLVTLSSDEPWPLTDLYIRNIQAGVWPRVSFHHERSGDRTILIHTDSSTSFHSDTPERFTNESRDLRIFDTDEDNENQLHIAIYNFEREIVRNIISLTPKPCFLDVRNSCGRTALHLAVITGQLEVTRMLVDAKASIETMDNFGNTPLHSATLNNDVATVEELLKCKYGHDLDQNITSLLSRTNDDGYTVCHLAVLNSNADIVRIFMHYSPKSFNVRSRKSGQTPLHIAVSQNDFNLSKYLVINAVNIEMTDFYGNTPLLIAEQNRHIGIVYFMIQAGADRSELEQGLLETLDNQ